MASKSGGVFHVKDWSSDKIIAVGITFAFIIIVIGADIVAVSKGDMSILNLGKELVIGLFGYMGRGAVNSHSSQNTPQGSVPTPTQNISNTLGTIADTASNAKTAIDAVENITNTFKKEPKDKNERNEG